MGASYGLGRWRVLCSPQGRVTCGSGGQSVRGFALLLTLTRTPPHLWLITTHTTMTHHRLTRTPPVLFLLLLLTPAPMLTLLPNQAQIEVHRRNAMNPEMGWWGLSGGVPGADPTMPDEMEYEASNAVGYNVSPQIEKGGPNARKNECYSRMLPWSWLARTGGVTTELRTRLRQPGMDYELRRVDSNGVEPGLLQDGARRGKARGNEGAAGTSGGAGWRERAGKWKHRLEATAVSQAYSIRPVKYHGNEGASHIAGE